MPPTTMATPNSCADDGVSPTMSMASPTDITGWASRMIDTTTAGSRGKDSEISR